MLQSGQASLALIIPGGFAREYARGAAASVQILLDGTNSTVAAITRGYALDILLGIFLKGGQSRGAVAADACVARDRHHAFRLLACRVCAAIARPAIGGYAFLC
jgi:hypothetical protein